MLGFGADGGGNRLYRVDPNPADSRLLWFSLRDIWQMGHEDQILVDINQMKYDKFRGVKIGLFALIPYAIFAVMLVLGKVMDIPFLAVAYRCSIPSICISLTR